MSAKLERINDEITKVKSKLSDYQTRLRELERQKTETENAEIVALVRGVEVAPDELRAFIEAYKNKQGGVKPTTAGLEDSKYD
jgi:chromosome segregation ATPase